MTDRIVILTGAGLSAESGLGTFRDEGGIWTRYPLEDVATPEGFARDPELVHAFYNERRTQAAEARANPAHAALAQLQRARGATVTVVTQNVDGLLEHAGADPIHMHGQLDRALCATCGHRWPAPRVMAPDDPCPACARRATRPDVVWFGEMPYHMDAILDALARCTLFAAIGTSGNVYPAAGFVEEASRAGAETLEINLEPTELTGRFDRHVSGPASQTVPDWVASVMRRDNQSP